jgi:hypothetical protein
MAQAQRSRKKVDVLILESGPTGLLLAEHFRQIGRDVVMLENNARLSDLEFLPDTDLTHEALGWLRQLLQRNFKSETLDLPPMTFSEGLVRPFVGFGENAPASHQELVYYTTPSEIRLSSALADLMPKFGADTSVTRLSGKIVTRLIPHEGRIDAVELNGEDILHPSLLIAPMHPQEVFSLLPPDTVDGKLRHRMVKSPNWTGVELHLKHGEGFAPIPNRFVLQGKGQEGEPVVGRFFQESGTFSRWLNLVSELSADNPDELAGALKHIKRQIKRAFPAEMASLTDERVIVSPASYGHFDLKGKPPFHLPGIGNLVLSSHLQSAAKGWLAAVDIARQIALLDSAITVARVEAPAPSI